MRDDVLWMYRSGWDFPEPRPKIPDLHFKYHCSAHNTFIAENVPVEFAKLSLFVLVSRLPEGSIFMMELDRFSWSKSPKCELMHAEIVPSFGLRRPRYANLGMDFAQLIYGLLREREVKVIVSMDVKQEFPWIYLKEKRGAHCHDKLLTQARDALGKSYIPRDLLNIQTGTSSPQEVNLFFHGTILYEEDTTDNDANDTSKRAIFDAGQTPTSYHHSKCFTFTILANKNIHITGIERSETLEQCGYSIVINKNEIPIARAQEHECEFRFLLKKNTSAEIEIRHDSYKSCGLLQQTQSKTVTSMSDGDITIFAGHATNVRGSDKVEVEPLTRSYKGEWNSVYNTCNFMSFDVGNREKRHMLTRAALLVGDGGTGVRPGIPRGVDIVDDVSQRNPPNASQSINATWSIKHLTFHNGCWLFVARKMKEDPAFEFEIPCKKVEGGMVYDKTCVCDTFASHNLDDHVLIEWDLFLDKAMDDFPYSDLVSVLNAVRLKDPP
jgi:hypothetical protein